MQNILIPTDFTVRSLKLITAATKHFEGKQLQIHLIHALEPDDSISGLLFMNKRLKVSSLYDETFLQACEILKNKHASVIHKITVAFYLGASKSYRSNFLNARKIDAIILPTDYKFKNDTSPDSVDPIKLWRKSDVPVIEVSIAEHKPALHSMENSMSELLHS